MGLKTASRPLISAVEFVGFREILLVYEVLLPISAIDHEILLAGFFVCFFYFLPSLAGTQLIPMSIKYTFEQHFHLHLVTLGSQGVYLHLALSSRAPLISA